MSYQREFEKKLNVAIVGVGSHAYRNILPIMTYLPVSLRAVCDIDLKRAQVTAAQYGAKAFYGNAGEMYQNEELDAVFLCVSMRWVLRLHPQHCRNVTLTVATLRNAKIIRNAKVHDFDRKLRRCDIFGGVPCARHLDHTRRCVPGDSRSGDPGNDRFRENLPFNGNYL